MAASKSLRRLRNIRQAEEEQMQAYMELAVAALQRLETDLTETRERVRRARVLIASSVHTGEVLDRIAGLEELRAADRRAKVLSAKVDAAEKQVQSKRRELLDKRVERRQVERVYEAVQAKDATAANRKSQLVLDDWHRIATQANRRGANAPRSESDIPLT
jgi:flagellar export protein FliJ